MANLSGFQSNTTIHAAFWIYKPDPTISPADKQQFIEVNSLQRIEASPQVILANIQSVQITTNTVTLTVDSTANLRKTQTVILSGLTNATFLNRAIASVTVQSATTLTFNLTHVNYGPTAEPAGALVSDAGDRKVWLFYAETAMSPSQAPTTLVGPAAALFVYDMEVLF